MQVGKDTVPPLAAGVQPSVHAPDGGESAGSRGRFGLHPFYVPLGELPPDSSRFALGAPTTRANAFRVLRAMQLRKPVLLEGSPGVGKTSLVQATRRLHRGCIGVTLG